MIQGFKGPNYPGQIAQILSDEESRIECCWEGLSFHLVKVSMLKDPYWNETLGL